VGSAYLQKGGEGRKKRAPNWERRLGRRREKKQGPLRSENGEGVWVVDGV